MSGEERALHAGRAAGLHAPHHDQRNVERQEEQRTPLHPVGQAEQDARGEQPPRRSRRAAGYAGSQPFSRATRSRLPVLVPVDQHRRERGQHERAEEDVQQRCPGQHQLEAVERHQQPGRAGQDHRVEHPVRDPDQDQDHQVPATAAGKRQPSSLLPNAFSPSAISHLPSGGCTTYAGPVGLLVPLDPVVQHVPRVGRVVDLVEDVALRLGDAVQPQDRRDQPDHAGDQPGVRVEPVVERLQATPDLVGHERTPTGVVGGRRADEVTVGRRRGRCRRSHPEIVGRRAVARCPRPGEPCGGMTG